MLAHAGGACNAINFFPRRPVTLKVQQVRHGLNGTAAQLAALLTAVLQLSTDATLTSGNTCRQALQPCRKHVHDVARQAGSFDKLHCSNRIMYICALCSLASAVQLQQWHVLT